MSEAKAVARAASVAPAGSWAGPAIDAVTLDFDARFRRRIAMTTDGGRELLLDLPEARRLAAGDGLVTEAGIVEVKAARERLAELTCRTPAQLLRLAWHLGNRHLPTELSGQRILIRWDHVIVDMARKLGASVREVSLPFNPEGGAYGEGRVMGHDHSHGHDHDHAQDHGHHHHHEHEPK